MHFLRHRVEKPATDDVTIHLEGESEETFSVDRRGSDGFTAEMRNAFHASEAKRRHEEKIVS